MEANANRTPAELPTALEQERERFRALVAKQLRAAEEATTDLRQQHAALQTEREQFKAMQETMRRQWEARWQDEWARIEQKDQEVAAERVALDQLRRDANGEVELQRRQLQASWSDLKREQHDWQQRLAAERSILDRQQQLIAERQQGVLFSEQAVQQERVLQEATLQDQRQELGRLEMRISNWRQKLDGLRGEAALLEAALCMPPAAPAQPKAGAEVNDPIPTPQAFSEQQQLISLLVQTATGLLDEARRMEEHQGRLLEVRSTWQDEWDSMLNHLSCREEELRTREERFRPREDSLRQREQYLEARLASWGRQHLELRSRETRLGQRQRALLIQRARLSDSLRSRKLALRRRRLMVLELQETWQQLRREEVGRLLHARTGCERARQEYLTGREQVRRRAQAVDDRERQLLQRELVVAQVEQRLIIQDPDPTGAQHVLDRLRAAWDQAVARQLQATRNREEELARRAGQLENFRDKLLAERQTLEELRLTLTTSQAEFTTERVSLTTACQDLQGELERLQVDHDHLQQRVRAQEANLEQLSMLLLDHRDEPPTLALVA
jgi:fused signal recognition particle receptor